MMRRLENGSIVLAVLVICLGLAVVVATMAAQLALARAGVRAEAEGRELLALADEGLAGAVDRASESWAPASFEMGQSLSVVLESVDYMDGPLLRARAVARSGDSTRTVTALVERGLDGLELPYRAAAVLGFQCNSGRVEPLVRAESAEATAAPSGVGAMPGWPPEIGPLEPVRVTVAETSADPPIVYGVSLEVGPAWSIEPLLPLPPQQGDDVPRILVVPPGLGVGTLLASLGNAALGRSPEMPVVLAGTGSGPLDVRGCGDLYAVLVSGRGGVLLEDTILHGAVMSEGVATMGSSGQIRFDSGVLEWARHRSIVRVRLVPGSREERVTGPGG